MRINMRRTLLGSLVVTIAVLLNPIGAEEIGIPTPEMKRLSFLLGKNTGKVTLFRDGAEGPSIDISHEGEWAAEGQFTAVKGRRGPEKQGVLMIWGYDPDAKIYKTWQFLSAPIPVGTPIFLTGRFEGNRLVLAGERPPFGANPSAQLRSTYEVGPTGGWRVTVEVKQKDEWIKASVGEVTPAK
jgi:hypothetical protein